ncbi:MAG: transcriptional regulator [Spirochaetia bacterium]|nr:transcriptional regulator [Spirochaetia bacterium]
MPPTSMACRAFASSALHLGQPVPSIWITIVNLLMFPLLETYRNVSIGMVDKVSTFCNIMDMKKVDENKFEESARLLKVLGHPMRLAMVETLSERTWCVCELADNLGLNKSAASKHLSLLKSVGVIEMERDGTQVSCTLVMTCVLEMMHCAKRGKNSTVKLEDTPNPPNESTPAACRNTSCCSPKKENI